MAYEVVKTIGARQYRYRVQSERDPLTGKSRNRWAYIGRVASERNVAAVRPPRTNARLRLLEAVERLLAAGDASAVTVAAITGAAGVAHGTFYRYFGDRSDVLQSLAQHIRATQKAGDDALLCHDIDSLVAARAGVRAWIVERLERVRQRRPALFAWYALMASDARLAAYREERRSETVARLSEHIGALKARGFADVADPAATAAMLGAFVDGVIQTTLLERDRLGAEEIAAAADLVERTLFARLDATDAVPDCLG
jgi:AcrR family transcriptional regulator